MSFKVSNSFKRCETISEMVLIQLFQLCGLLNVKHTPKAPPNSLGFKVSTVSIYISPISEMFQKVLAPPDRGRAMLITGRQDYTSSLQRAVPSLSGQRAEFSFFAGYLAQEVWW